MKRAILALATLIAFAAVIAMPQQPEAAQTAFAGLHSYRQQEQAAAIMGAITPADNRFIVKRLDALDQVGKDLVTCLSHPTPPTPVCKTAAITPIDKVSTMAILGIKDDKARADFTAALVALKGKINAIQ